MSEENKNIPQSSSEQPQKTLSREQCEKLLEQLSEKDHKRQDAALDDGGKYGALGLTAVDLATGGSFSLARLAGYAMTGYVFGGIGNLTYDSFFHKESDEDNKIRAQCSFPPAKPKKQNNEFTR